MKSNRGNTPTPSTPKNTLYQTLTREKEALVTMFLSRATQNELTEQIRKIDELCLKLDSQQKRNLPQ